MKDRFAGKTIVITGASGGIGICLTKAFAQEGANLCLVDMKTDALEQICEQNSLNKNRCIIIKADISNEKEVEAFIESAVAEFGGIDVMVNNAGIVGAAEKVWNFPGESLEQVLSVNVMGTFYGMKYSMKKMVMQGGGVVINVSSISGVKGMPDTIGYVASKHAITGMTKTAAVEAAKAGVRVCAVCPAPVATPMMQEVEDGIVESTHAERHEVRSRLSEPIPMGRYARPEEVANTILFLASQEASFITGSVVMVDGGFTA